jgi:D-glucosaminate-6-phosphate ammonia-lyase
VTVQDKRQIEQAGLYSRIGVRQIINASGATTAVGGTLMLPEVVDAMVEASRSFVVIEELNAKVGEAIAVATGAEAGYVTSGSAAGMLLAIAACITGTNRAAIKRLPDTTGLPNEVVIHRAHRIGYDQMFRAPGATFVEIGIPSRTEPWELEEAIMRYLEHSNQNPKPFIWTKNADQILATYARCFLSIYDSCL